MSTTERIEIILPHGLRGDDERDAIGIFEEEFAFVGVPVADSGLRTILDSQEPPLNFAIQLLTSSFAQGVEASLLATALFGGSKQMARAVVGAYHSIARRFPNRRVHISLRLGPGDESVPSYSLSADQQEAEKQIEGIARDLTGTKVPRGRREWYDDVWMSPEDYFAARRAERESEGEG